MPYHHLQCMHLQAKLTKCTWAKRNGIHATPDCFHIVICYKLINSKGFLCLLILISKSKIDQHTFFGAVLHLKDQLQFAIKFKYFSVFWMPT